jgi:hypothetical protein
MALLGSIAKLQNHGIQFYTDLARIFDENQLIRETWTCMAQDLKHQASSLQALPHSFWAHLKTEQERLRQAVQNCWMPSVEDETEKTLQHFLLKTLDFEQPLILGVYVPLIRRLRSAGSGHVLDLYIIVKAHVSRLLHVIRSFSANPVCLQRVATLIQEFEKEVQVPREVPAAKPRGATPTHAQTEKAKLHASASSEIAGGHHRESRSKNIIGKGHKPILKVSRRAQR